MSQRSYSGTDIKTLFALSRNICAFTDVDSRRGCEERLTDPAWGRVKGQIAHIRGWLPGSARHDPDYESPHRYENLILLCPNHHVEIDELEPEKYTVEVLEEMKLRSEGKGTNAEWVPTADASRKLYRQALGELAIQRLRAQQANLESLQSRLVTELQVLPEAERLVFVLRYVEHFSRDEVAEVMDRPVASVSGVEKRARAKLRTALDLPPRFDFDSAFDFPEGELGSSFR